MEWVAAAFDHRPLTPELLSLAAGPRSRDELVADAAALGYGTDAPASARISVERPT